MKRIGGLILVVLLFASLLGCSEKSSSVKQTGLNLRFTNCLTCAVWVWIDGDYVATCTVEQANFIEVPPGNHSLFARANIVVADSSYCWSRDFSVSDGAVTELVLDCIGARCE